MILTRLKEYADTRMDLPPAMYEPVPVAWLIKINHEGKLLGFIDLRGSDKREKRGRVMQVPSLVRASGIKPKLLADNGEYTLGIGREGGAEGKIRDRHLAYRTLVTQCAGTTQEPALQAVEQFLEYWDADPDKQRLLPVGYDPQDNLTFAVVLPGGELEGILPIELTSVQFFWSNYTAGETVAADAMMCLVSGEVGSVESRMPQKVKRIPGGQASGVALVSANSPSFTSFGLEASRTAPIARDAAERVHNALNHLLASEESRLSIGSMVYVWWTQQQAAFSLRILSNPTPKEVELLLMSALRGQPQYGVDTGAFYLLGLSANVARAVVREWLEAPLARVERHLVHWFEAQRMVDPYGNETDPLGIYALAACLYRDPVKEMQPAIPAALMRTALGGAPLPHELLVRAVLRNQAEKEVTRPRAAFIKLYLTNHEWPMETFNQLQEHPQLIGTNRIAYACGRLMSVLESIQQAAQRQVNATLVDRYYGAASATPSMVFAALIKDAQAHLSKLRKKQPGTCEALQKRLEEVLLEIPAFPAFPTTFTVEERGLFALGYYHQRAASRSAAQAAKAAKAANSAEASA
jgi:CRISPR-associated protein Csd1